MPADVVVCSLFGRDACIHTGSQFSDAKAVESTVSLGKSLCSATVPVTQTCTETGMLCLVILSLHFSKAQCH